MRYNDFLKEIKTTKKRVFGFVGENEFLKDEGISILKSVFKPDENFGIQVIDAKRMEEIEVLEALNSGSFMGQHLIIVENIENVDGRKEDIQAWMKKAPPETIAVFRTAPVEVDITTKFYKQIASSGMLVECWNLSSSKGEVRQWAFYRIQRMGKNADQQALDYLEGRTGNNLYRLANEIKKLVIYVGDRPTIRVSDVRDVVEVTVDTDIFDLLKAVTEKKKSRALNMVGRLFRGSETGLGLITLLQMHLDRMLKVVIWQRQGMGEHEMTYKLGVHPFVARDIIRQCHSATPEWIYWAYGCLKRADKSIKTGFFSSRMVIERMVLELCR